MYTKQETKSGGYKDGAKLLLQKQKVVYTEKEIKSRKQKVMHMHCSSRAKKICQITVVVVTSQVLS